MLTGAKIGAIIGRKRAFAIGCVIYRLWLVHDLDRPEPALCCSSAGRSRKLAYISIMPAIVALVAWETFRPSGGQPRTDWLRPPGRSPSPSAR